MERGSYDSIPQFCVVYYSQVVLGPEGKNIVFGIFLSPLVENFEQPGMYFIASIMPPFSGRKAPRS